VDVTEAERIDEIEVKLGAAFDLLQKVADALRFHHDQIEETRARLHAHIVLTGSLLVGLKQAAPEAAQTIVHLLEQSERDLDRSNVHEATVQELRDILTAFRSQSPTGLP
jgi:hypothetical protein